MGTWARAPQVQFCSSPIWSPQMRAHRQNRGETKCTFIKLKTQTPRVQENVSLGRRRGGSGGQYPGTRRDRGWALGLQELETRVPVSGMQIGSLGGRHCQGLGRGSRVQRLQPRGGWGGSFREALPAAQSWGPHHLHPVLGLPHSGRDSSGGAEAGFTHRHLLGLEREGERQFRSVTRASPPQSQ